MSLSRKVFIMACGAGICAPLMYIAAGMSSWPGAIRYIVGSLFIVGTIILIRVSVLPRIVSWRQGNASDGESRACGQREMMAYEYILSVAVLLWCALISGISISVIMAQAN